ncbi:MAG: hypothetical protein HWE26_21380 [Alteromonadaceae bacterium]|nr:hypothetical protein [Alteromonadaceae bacterium]
MHKLPPEPEEPHLDDCCGGGCCPCIWDIYYDRLTQWRETKQKYEEQNADNPAAEKPNE